MRVFVLGAGASFHAGYPLAADLGNSLATWIDTLSPEHQHRSCLEQLVEAYESLDDFEAILADLMTCTPGSRAGTLGTRRPRLLENLKEAIREYFDAIRSTPAPLYDGLARILRHGDKIITFNYDLGVERALHAAGLWNVECGYGFSIEEGTEPSPVEVLKLHGSTNWRALAFGGRTGFFVADLNSLGDRPVLYFRSDLEYLGYPDFVDPLCSGLQGAICLPAMILPALPKVFYFATSFGQEWRGFWDSLWRRAEHAIKNADELVIIGYSLPAADERARDTLLSSTNKAVRLSICCHSATRIIEQEFCDHGFKGIVSVSPTFEGFLASEKVRDDRSVATPIPHKFAHDGAMDTLARLNQLIGKKGLLNIANHREVEFTFLSVDPASYLPTEADDDAFQNAITLSSFRAHFDEVMIDGSDTRMISGFYISRIFGDY
jgi:hypothetical protein